MLVVGSGLAVTGDNAPLVGQQPHLAASHGDHRLDGDGHALLEHQAGTWRAVVGYGRVLVHLAANAMAGELADDAEAGFLRMLLDDSADVADMMPWLCRLDAELQTLLRHAEQTLHLRTDLSHTERVARVAVPAVELAAAVHGDNVALLQHTGRPRYAVYDHVVDRGADRAGKRPTNRIREVLERWPGAMRADELLSDVVQLKGRYTGFDMSTHLCEGCTDKSVGPSHEVDFVFSLKKYSHCSLSSFKVYQVYQEAKELESY